MPSYWLPERSRTTFDADAPKTYCAMRPSVCADGQMSTPVLSMFQRLQHRADKTLTDYHGRNLFVVRVEYFVDFGARVQAARAPEDAHLAVQ